MQVSINGVRKLLFAGVMTACAPVPRDLPPEEIDVIRTTLQAYRQAWLNNDTATVLNTLSEEIALLMPGTTPNVVGKQHVKDFWFPPADLKYPIRVYEIRDEEIFGSGTYATAHGASLLIWETVKGDSIIAADTSRTEYLTVLKKETTWKIYRQMFHSKD